MVGTTLSHYRVLELLGRGGMGEVYAAEDLKLRRKVALKVLPRDMAADRERRRRFEREARAVAALNHPGIVTIYSVEHERDIAFLTMEFIEGQTLAEVVPAGGLPLDDLLRLAIPLADAVHSAHASGILHRDLKPGNVMVTPDGRIKILDFGLAKLAEPAPTAGVLAMPAGAITTGDGQIVGTLSYMAPEQAEGKAVDHRADIFALGVLLYELATGVRPFAGESNVTILIALLRDNPLPLTEVRRDLPPALGGIVQRCLEKDPALRYQSAAELGADLEALRGARPGAQARGASARQAPRTTRSASIAAAAMISLLAVLVGWLAMRSPLQPVAVPSASPAPDAGVSASVPITGNRVALLDFENRTGDPQLASFGRTVSEAIAAGLVAQGLAVVTATEASANDGITVTGALSLTKGSLRFDARVLSASRGTLVRAVEPVVMSRENLIVGTDNAQRSVVAAVLATLGSSPRIP